MRLNAETDSTPIQVPARGFSLLREWASSGSINSQPSSQPDGAPLSRGASVLRTLSQMGRWGSHMPVPTTDLENQLTEYRGAAVVSVQDQTNASTSTDGPARSDLSFYQTRGQQWGSQASLHHARSTTSARPAAKYYPVAPRCSKEIAEPLGPDVPQRPGIGPGRYLPREDAVAPVPAHPHEPFRREV